MSIKENVTEEKSCKTIRYLFCAAFFVLFNVFFVLSPANASSMPENLQYKCSADGQSIVVSWEGPGPSGYYIRFDYTPNNSAICYHGWLCDSSGANAIPCNSNGGLDYCVDGYSGTSFTRTIVPDTSYSLWIHATDANGVGSPTHLNPVLCRSPADCNKNPEDDRCPGSKAFCALKENSNHDLCPGTDAYCNSSPDHRLEPICTEGDPAYCKLPQHINESVCIVGDDAFCEQQHNKSNPACIVGSDEFCALPQHENHTECPGTISYCTKYPQSPHCGVVGVESPCVKAGNCTAKYQVNMTNKSTTIGTLLCTAVYYIQSGLGRIIATVAILMLALAVTLGKASWVYATKVGVGIATLFGVTELTVFFASNISTLGGVLACLVKL